jgi:Asp/Glu/hydantoin racemase
MRLLLLNANSSESITDLVVSAARRLAAPSTELVGITARFGPRYIGTRTAYAIAGHAALDAYAAYGADADAILLACFGDPGLAALREVAPVPVVGMAEAGCQAAVARGGRFAIVTGGVRWITMLTEYVATLGLSDYLAGVHAVAPTGAEIAVNPEGSVALLADACRQAVKKSRADVVVLGGAGLAGIARQVAESVPFPVIDGLAAAIAAAENAAAREGSNPNLLQDPLPAVGLSPELQVLLEQHRK